MQTNHTPMAVVTLRLPAARLDGLRGRAEHYGLSLADLLRRSIDEGLPGTLEKLATLEPKKRKEGARES